MKTATAEVRLERLLDALSVDLAEASDLELIQAAEDLRMNLTMRGTAAFLGLKSPLYFPYRPFKFQDVPANERDSDHDDLDAPSSDKR